MPEVMHNLVADARKNRFSGIPKLSEEDIISVWDTVSEYIELQMCTQRGVHVPNLGTFTFTHKKMDIGNNKFILIQRPVFVLSEKFAQTHALQYTKHHTTGEIPVVQLNFTSLAVESPFDRDTVETCVREVLQSLSRAVSNLQNVEFLFRGIGVLGIKESKVKMKFFKDFLNSMDGSGNLVKVLENELFHSGSYSGELVRKYDGKSKKLKRPGTADSVMSNQTTLSAHRRPGTNTITLPKLNSGKEVLPPIAEQMQDEGDGEKIPLPPTRGSNREVIRPHQVVGVSLAAEELREALPAREGVRGSPVRKMSSPPNPPPKPATSPPQQDTKETPHVVQEETIEDTPRPVSAPLQTPEPQLRVSARYAPSRRSSQFTPIECSSPAHHLRAGQELCYLCMQRSMRNVPVSFEEERRRKELEQDALLQQYQQMKDQEAILMQQANQNQNRHINQKVAAFNLGVAECLRDTKGKRSTDFVKSYVFQNRPLTPLRFYKQEEYSKALESQVKMKYGRENREKHDREFQERLEQVQLAEDLAAQREQFLRAKADQISRYQKALSAQIRSKPLPLPKAEPDSKDPIFGRFDATNEKLLEQRERSRNLLKSQLEMVSEKKKNSILQHLGKQKEESEMLQRTKQELIEDRVNTHKRAYEMRRSLENNWQNHHLDKVGREDEEKMRLRTPGMLLLQQTDKYKRCGQCERRTNNCGESNIWSESRYIPGSRLMV
uniref:coiled-coil domain-containing protein 81 isoform X3 n=1 Tax=Ciona intestinalis TaxID=7719 RepID=UPI0005216408|nr:coiled-coil domain-containing protein 81 isoform X3 [Ciona intestinalis]|eukprot:XP_009861828.1 coiled-coil domain-containing protein 81 isoform X3 [Ciona intestinalis]